MPDGNVHNATQLSLFGDQALLLGGLNQAVKAAMAAAAADSGLSREHILDRMNATAEAAGVRLTTGNARSLALATLEKWLAPAEREHLPSALAIVAFCRAVRDWRALAVLATACGCRIVTADEEHYLRLGRAYHESKRARAAMREIEAKLK